MFKIGDKVQVSYPISNHIPLNGNVGTVEKIFIFPTRTEIQILSNSITYWLEENELTYYIQPGSTTQSVPTTQAPLPIGTQPVSKFKVGDRVTLTHPRSRLDYNKGNTGIVQAVSINNIIIVFDGQVIESNYSPSTLTLKSLVHKEYGTKVRLTKDFYPHKKDEEGIFVAFDNNKTFEIEMLNENLFLNSWDFMVVEIVTSSTKKKIACECGGHSLSTPSHSHWCPEHKPFTKAN